MPDYYAVLGVDRGASAEEIKRAYRRLARQYHPDANPGDPSSEERFKQISEAYEVLNDPARRQRYDTFGDARGEQSFGFGDLGDIMETFFGGSPFGGGFRRASGPERGADLEVAVELTLEQAARGAQVPVTLDDLVACERCTGSGCEPGTFKVRCDRCGGAGAISQTARSIFGTVMTQRTCPSCGGAGETAAAPCKSCSGSGIVQGRRNVPVAIPGGVQDGMNVRVGGAGRIGRRGGPAGDLYVRIHVAEHPVFRRDDDDLHCDVGVPFTIAALGGEVPVPTLEDDQIVHVDAGTRSGTTLRLRGLGADRLNARGRGDIVAHVLVDVPRELSGEERELIEKLAALRGDVVDEGDRGFVSRVRGALRKER